ncbi:MAG: PAS domain S-box protein [Anaerolinea sp.]|nr:PAS domain S-box protein [Anaerolinea sp.]
MSWLGLTANITFPSIGVLPSLDAPVVFTFDLVPQAAAPLEPTSTLIYVALVLLVVIGMAAYVVLRQQRLLLQKTRAALTERDQVQQSLRESEERFRLISSVTSDYTFSSRVNERGELLHTLLTGAFTEITGYTPEEFLALGGWRATIHPDDVAQDERDMAALRRSERVISELRVLRKGGEVRWVRVYAIPILDEHGTLVGINGGVQDIHARKLAEDAVRRSEVHLRALLDATSDAAFLLDRNGTLLTLNEALARPIDMKIDDLIGKNAFAMLDPEISARRRSYFDRVLATDQPVQWEDQGSVGWFANSVYPVHAPSGEIEAFAIYSRDITEQKRLEAEVQTYTTQLEHLVDVRTTELRHANNQLELILNTTADALAFAQPNGDIIKVNAAYRALFNDSATRFIEQITTSVPDERQAAAVSAALWRVVADQQRQQLEIQVTAPDGSERDVDLTILPVRVIDGNMRSGILLNGHDITHLKEIERFKARFVANAVHDLATPISGLSARIYLLRRSPEKLAEHVRALENQVQHLQNLVDELRMLSRIDRGQLVPSLAMTDVNELTQRIFDTYEPVALDKQQTLTLRLDPSLPKIAIDAQQIERVLLNLIANAVNYTPAYRGIRVETLAAEGEIIIRVADEGIGISPEDLPRVFERFYRSAEARRSNRTGTGLGLAITKEILDLHRGTVAVHSELDKGSTFTVRLPHHLGDEVR